MSDIEIIKEFYTDKGRINPHKTVEQYLDSHPIFKSYLTNRFSDSSSIRETLYRIKNNIEDRPTCKCCGASVTFVNPYRNGFSVYCSTKCARNDIRVTENSSINDTTIIHDVIKENKVNYNKIKEKYLVEHNYKSYLITRYSEFNTYIETIYRIVNNIEKIPICDRCGKQKKFISYELGYRCSKICENKEEINDEYIKKIYANGYKGFIMKPDFLKNSGIQEYLDKKYQEPISIREKLYRICNDIKEIPICPVCGNKVNFSKLTNTYPECCSGECTKKYMLKKLLIPEDINDDTIIEYTKNYKFPNRETELKANGYYDYVLNRFETNDINENLYRIVNHIEESPRCKYCGEPVKFISYLKGYHEFCSTSCALRNSASKLYKDIYHWDLKFTKNNEVFIENYCKIHGNISISLADFTNRMKHDRQYDGCLCLLCNPKVINSFLETRIEKIIKDILEKNTIKYVLHDRILIKPKELDFYLPDYNVGIECNGIYWHSLLLNDNKKILKEKINKCKVKDISLIVLWEDEILNDKNLEKTLLDKINLKLQQLVIKFYYDTLNKERVNDVELIKKFNKLSNDTLFERYNVYRCWTI